MAKESRREAFCEPAAAWHDRMNRDLVTDDIRREFGKWLAQSPERRAAYEAVDQAWVVLQAAAQDPQLLALRHETTLRLTRLTSLRIRPLRWAAAAMILVAFGAAVAFLVLQAAGEHSLTARLLAPFQSQSDGRYATATGERSTITLSDSSQVTLDTQTEVQVVFAKAERVVRLIRGQAIFEVAKDRARPFVVEVHNRRFVAVGTAFDVRLDGQEIKVTMIEGTVRVEREGMQGAAANGHPMSIPHGVRNERPGSASAELDLRAAAAAIVTTLTAGEQLTVDAQAQDHVHPADADRATSWRRGQVIFDNTRLIDAIAELNRYSQVQIELADPALADLRLSGAFATGRPTVFIEAVTSYFPLRVSSADHRAVVLAAQN